MWGFPGVSDSKESACNAGDLGSISGSGRFPGGGNDNPLQYSCLENPLDRELWKATAHGVTKNLHNWATKNNLNVNSHMWQAASVLNSTGVEAFT